MCERISLRCDVAAAAAAVWPSVEHSLYSEQMHARTRNYPVIYARHSAAAAPVHEGVKLLVVIHTVAMEQCDFIAHLPEIGW